MTAPVALVELGFGSTWQTEPGDITWTDVSDQVMKTSGVDAKRGASSSRGKVDTGTCSLTLRNDDRRFDPTHVTGPYYGDLVPGVPVRVSAGVAGGDLYEDVYVDLYGGPEVVVWRGTVANWPQRYLRGNTAARVPIEAWDGFDKLSRAKIPRSVLEKEILEDSPIAYWKLDETSGSLMADSSGNGRDGAYLDGTLRLSDERALPGGGSYRGIDFDGEHEGQSSEVLAAVAGRPFTIFGLVQIPFDGTTTNDGVILRCGSGNPGNSTTSRNAEVGYTATANGLDLVGQARDGGTNDACAASDLAVGITEPCVFTLRRQSPTGASEMWVNGVDETDIIATSAEAFASHPGVSVGSESDVVGGQSALVGWLSNVAMFQSDLGEARIAELASIADAPLDEQTTDERIGWILDELGWPATARDFETGRTLLGPATFKPGDKALEYLRLVTASEDGLLFVAADGTLRFLDRYWRYLDPLATISQFTFTDQNAAQSYAEFDLNLDDELLVNVARFTRRDGTEQVASDATSVSVYGEAEAQQSDLLHRTDAEVASLAQWTVATQSTPLPRVPKIRVPLHRYSTDDQATVLALDLGHRVTCQRTPQGVGAQIALDFVIDGISNETDGHEWWWTAYVSPVPEATVELFLLSDSLMSGTDVMAY